MNPAPEGPSALRPGGVIDGFVLEAKVALGGMAEIWAAHRESDEAPVALKVLLPQFAHDPAFRAMFHDEVRIATQLEHPAIVEVFAAHEAAGLVFQSMEWLEGCDLRRLLSHLVRGGRRLPTPLALGVARAVAGALAYAHRRAGPDGRPLDIVHRDVSPHNVMLLRDGRVKLLDFGIARAAERASRTRTGVIKGKLAYMAPEQALAVGVTPQTDIFALGVVLWEMLAMERLFSAATDAELLEKVVRAEVPDIRDHDPEVPAEIAELIVRMTALRAPNRPASMEVVEEALARALARLPGDASEAALTAFLAEQGPPAPPSMPPILAQLSEEEAMADTALNAFAGDPTDPEGLGLAPTRTLAHSESDDDTLPPDTVALSIPDGEPDQARTVLDAPAPDDLDLTPSEAETPPAPGPRRPSRLRAPSRSEIVRAVDAQVTVEVEADPSLVPLRPSPAVQVETRPPLRSAADTMALPAPAEHPTQLGALVPPEAPGVTVDDDRFEPLGLRPPVTELDEELPPARASPPANRRAWVLPAITGVLAVVVLVLIFLLIRGQ